MSYNPDRHHRRSIRIKGYDYSNNGAYYMTICTQNRELLFGNVKNKEMHLNEYGNIANKYWLDLSERYPNIMLDEYIIMPNHIHGIIFIQNNDNTVGVIHELPLHDPKQRRKMLIPKIVGYFDMNVAKQINILRNTRGKRVWQRNYYEHVIRDEADLNRIREYIINNPANWYDDENFIP